MWYFNAIRLLGWFPCRLRSKAFYYFMQTVDVIIIKGYLMMYESRHLIASEYFVRKPPTGNENWLIAVPVVGLIWTRLTFGNTKSDLKYNTKVEQK